MRSRLRERVITESCPRCGAGLGTECRTKGGKPRKRPHEVKSHCPRCAAQPMQCRCGQQYRCEKGLFPDDSPAWEREASVSNDVSLTPPRRRRRRPGRKGVKK